MGRPLKSYTEFEAEKRMAVEEGELERGEALARRQAAEARELEQNRRDNAIRQRHNELAARLREARTTAENADADLELICDALARGEATEEQALQAFEARERARARVTVWQKATGSTGQDAAIAGRY